MKRVSVIRDDKTHEIIGEGEEELELFKATGVMLEAFREAISKLDEMEERLRLLEA